MADAATTKARVRRSGAARPSPEVPAEPPAAEAGPSPYEAEVAESLSRLRHRRGCPAEDVVETGLTDVGARIEVIEHRVVGRGLDADRGGSTDGLRALIVRCVECGAQDPDDT